MGTPPSSSIKLFDANRKIKLFKFINLSPDSLHGCVQMLLQPRTTLIVRTYMYMVFGGMIDA